jgi:glyoxylase-like metal-dependent hydrolase (beta-lactamase superfamily II)
MPEPTAQAGSPPHNGSPEVRCFSGGAFGENGYVLRCPASDRAVVVDPGASAPEMVRALRDAGDILEGIYLTHAHFDHVEGIPTILGLARVPVYLHPADRPLYDLAEAGALAFGARLPGPLPPVDRELVPGKMVPVGEQSLEVRFAPGHAPGHVILYSGPGGFALVGDVIFQGSIGRTDLPGGDFRQLIDSIRSEVLSLPDETRLLAGHGPETTVARERMGNPFLISQARGGYA